MKKLNIYRVTEKVKDIYFVTYYITENISSLFAMRTSTAEVIGVDKINTEDESVHVEVWYETI